MRQNSNELFNVLIWEQCPKATFTARKILEISVFSSILNYNNGFSSLSCLFKMLVFKLFFFKLDFLDFQILIYFTYENVNIFSFIKAFVFKFSQYVY